MYSIANFSTVSYNVSHLKEKEIEYIIYQSGKGLVRILGPGKAEATVISQRVRYIGGHDELNRQPNVGDALDGSSTNAGEE